MNLDRSPRTGNFSLKGTPNAPIPNAPSPLPYIALGTSLATMKQHQVFPKSTSPRKLKNLTSLVKSLVAQRCKPLEEIVRNLRREMKLMKKQLSGMKEEEKKVERKEERKMRKEKLSQDIPTIPVVNRTFGEEMKEMRKSLAPLVPLLGFKAVKVPSKLIHSSRNSEIPHIQTFNDVDEGSNNNPPVVCVDLSERKQSHESKFLDKQSKISGEADDFEAKINKPISPEQSFVGRKPEEETKNMFMIDRSKKHKQIKNTPPVNISSRKNSFWPKCESEESLKMENVPLSTLNNHESLCNTESNVDYYTPSVRFYDNMMPAPEVQKQLILQTNCGDSQLDISSFAISINWWKSWCDYINIEFDELIKNSNLSHNNTSKASESNRESLVKGVNPGDESVLDLVSDLPSIPSPKSPSKPLPDQNLLSWQELYPPPGKIDNSCLIKLAFSEDIAESDSDNQQFEFNKEMMEGYDYVKVTEDVWERLAKWYDYDYELKFA
ncbi:unnamed protein product [Moneuplotes crassus]|uniref:DUSP domain-containing protein n=1 Tax=Euplotes crassus TaxID=5936 RepID=A0AAD1YAT5_EUPCR|nr:unnamed protein product [Moneuplotes crassus]